MEGTYEEMNSFSFLHPTMPIEQEEFLRQLKDINCGVQGDGVSDVNAVPTSGSIPDYSVAQLENVFSFSPALSQLMAQQQSLQDDPVVVNDGASPARSWKIVHVSPLFMNANSFTTGTTLTVPQIAERVRVEIRTRSDKANLCVPERMYSSLKYEMKHIVCKSCVSEHSNVLMSKVEIVDPSDHFEEILKTNGQKLIKGVSEMTAMSRNSAGTHLECKMKIQFTDVSYHHEKKFFAFKVSFFDPSFNMEEPVLIMVSAPFQVFARRPTRKTGEESSAKEESPKPIEEEAPAKPTKEEKKSGSKRKISAVASASESQPPAKKAKIVSVDAPAAPTKEEKIQLKKGAVLQDFIKCLDLLVAFKNSLKEDEQKVALDIAQRRLLGQPKKQPKHGSDIDFTALFADV